jgi:hypothetical protein
MAVVLISNVADIYTACVGEYRSNSLEIILGNTSSGFLWHHRCVTILSSPVQN